MKNFKKIGLLLTLGVFLTGALNAQTEIINEGFESGIPSDWSTIDADGDSYNWTTESGGTSGGSFLGHEGSATCVSSASYINGVGTLTPDNYLVTPELNLSSEGTLTFWVCAQDGNYPAEHYAVYASTTGNQVADFSDDPLVEETLASKSAKVPSAVRGTRAQGIWHKKTVTLPFGTKYVAFRHFECTDNYWLNIDDVVITGETIEIYDLYIVGIQVNEINASDLSFIEGVNGTINYDNDTKTLTLENVTINTTDEEAIKNEDIADLQIKLIGENNLTTESNSTVFVKANTEINGTGSLTVTTNGNEVYHTAIDIQNKSAVTIKDCSVEANAPNGYAIAGYNAEEDLIVNNATVKATGYKGSVGAYLKSLTLINCSITAPAGAAFDESLHGVALSGSLVTEQVVIEPDNGIEDIEILGVSVYPNPALDFIEISIANANIKGLELQVYDMLGKLLQQQTITAQTTHLNIKNLEKGVYIVKIGNNTQRFVKR